MNCTYETERLILRVLRAENAPAVLQFYLDNRALFEQYEAARPDNFYTTRYQKTLLNAEYNLAFKLSAVRFYVFLKDAPEQIIGSICFRNITRAMLQSCEVGYKFDARFHHQGYAFEALTQGIDIIFQDVKLHRIVANVMPSNLPSIRLLENLDFSYEGLERQSALICGKWQDHARYALLNPIP